MEVREVAQGDNAFSFVVTEEAMRHYVEATVPTWDEHGQGPRVADDR